MHSLPSRRRLPQPIFFRFKCYRLSPLLVPPPPPSLPAPAPPAPLLLPGLLPDARLPVNAPPLVSANAHALTLTLTPGAAGRQARPRPAARGQTHTSGTEADARLDGGAVCCQGRGTFSQSANRDLVITPVRLHP